MKAMVLAAGLGTRLRPLTDDRPKALVTVAGRTLLEITLSRLRSFGVNEVIVNVHHFADSIVDYLQANRNFGMRIEISREEELLDTGGGLKKAAWFFLEGRREQGPTFSRPQCRCSQHHRSRPHGALPHRAQRPRHTGRSAARHFAALALRRAWPALRPPHRSRRRNRVGPPSATSHTRSPFLAFTSFRRASLPSLPEEGAFSIIPAYLRLAAQGEAILAFRADAYYWRDLGRPEDIAEAERDMASAKYSA